MGGAPRCGPDRARHFRALVRGRACGDDLQRGLLRGRRVCPPARNDARRVAERLGVVSPPREHVPPPLEVDALGSLELVEFEVRANHAVAGSAVREVGLPRSRARRGRGTWRDDSTPREHGPAGGRSVVRPCAALHSSRSRGRLRALAPPRVEQPGTVYRGWTTHRSTPASSSSSQRHDLWE